MNYSLLLRLCATISPILFFSSEAFAQARLYSLSGSELHTCAQNSASLLGDVNDDGYPEIVVGGNTYCTLNGLSNVSIAEAKNGKVLRSIYSDQSGDWEGASVAVVGDVDGDNKPDFLSGASRYDVGNFTDAGRVRLLSGRTGIVLHTFSGTASQSFFGSAIAALGPVAGEQYAILCGSTATLFAAPASNFCKVYDVSDPTLRYTLTGTADDGFGSAVVPLPDLTGDGVQEFAVSRPGFQLNLGRVEIRRAQDGALLNTIVGTPLSRFGIKMWALGQDITGAPLLGVFSHNPYALRVYRVSATTATVVFSRNYGGPDVTSVAEVGDFDGDQQRDLAIGTPFVQGWQGQVEIVSKQGALIKTITGEGLARRFGEVVANLGDINGDGVLEAGFVSNEQAQGNSSLNVFSPLSKSATINQCNSQPVDFFVIDGTVRPGAQVVLRGRVAGAPNSRVYFNFSQVNWYYSAPLAWFVEPNYPGCRTNLDAQTLTPGVSVTTDALGNFQYNWSVPNIASVIGMQFRASAATAVGPGYLQLLNEIVFKVQP